MQSSSHQIGLTIVVLREAKSVMAVDVGNISHSISNHQSQAVTHLHRDINRRIVDANSVVRVLDIVEDSSQDFNAVNISTAFHRLARMWRDLPELSSTESGGQGRLHNALQTLIQLAVIHIKEVHLSSNADAQASHNSCLLADNLLSEDSMRAKYISASCTG